MEATTPTATPVADPPPADQERQEMRSTWLRRTKQVMRTAGHVLCVMALCAILYVYGQIQYRSFYEGNRETDIAGYVLMAKKFQAFELPVLTPDTPFQYQTHVWVENDRGEVLPKYTPGFPILIAIFNAFLGDDGMFFVSPVLGAVMLIGAFLLFWEWMGQFAALLATATVATNHLWLRYAGYPLAHSADVCFVVWGMFFLWKFMSRPTIAFGIGAGLCLGFAVMIRPASAMFGVGVPSTLLAVLIWNRRELRKTLLPSLALVLAYALFPVLMGLYNQRAFGGFFTTGYALSNEQTGFTLEMFKEHAGPMAMEVMRDCLYIALPLGLIGAIVLGNWNERLIRVVWMLGPWVLYTSYYWIGSGYAFTRFYTIIVPVVVGCAFALTDRAARARYAAWLGAVVLAAAILWMGWDKVKQAYENGPWGPNFAGAEVVTHAASDVLEHDAVIFTSGPFTYSLAMRRQFEVFDLSAFNRRHVRSLPKEEERHGHDPRGDQDRWARLRAVYEKSSQQDLREARSDLIRKRLEAGRQVALVLPERFEPRRAVGGDFEAKLISEIPAPEEGRDRGFPWKIYELHLPAPPEAKATTTPITE